MPREPVKNDASCLRAEVQAVPGAGLTSGLRRLLFAPKHISLSFGIRIAIVFKRRTSVETTFCTMK